MSFLERRHDVRAWLVATGLAGGPSAQTVGKKAIPGLFGMTRESPELFLLHRFSVMCEKMGDVFSIARSGSKVTSWLEPSLQLISVRTRFTWWW